MSKNKQSAVAHSSPNWRATSATASASYHTLIAFGLIALAAIVAYSPSINGGFIWDDYLLLVDNALVKAADGLQRIWCTAEAVDYWPATNTSFWIEWRLWDLHSAGYHVTNLILHVVESLLIWIILRKLSIPGALLAAVIFAVHPVNVESVAWIAQRKNTMAMLFFLLSILWYLKAVMPTTRARSMPPFHPSSFILHPSFFYWLSLAAFVLAMLGKGSVAVLPVLLLGIVWWLRSAGRDQAAARPVTSRDLVRIAPFFVVAVILAFVNVEFQYHATEKVVRQIGFIDRLLGAGGVVWFYLYKAVFPLDLAFVYRQWHIDAGNLLWWLPLAACAAVTAALWLYRKSWSRELLFAWGFFCISLAPVMGFTDVAFMQYSLVADRYQHVAIIAVVALASAVWAAWLAGARGAARLAGAALAFGAVGALVLLTMRQNALYRNAMTLYEATLAKNPDCIMAQYNYANALSKMNRPADAIEHYQRAISLKPDFAMAHFALGNALAKAGRAEEAIGHFHEFLRLKPDYAEVRNSLGNAFMQLGRAGEAIAEYERALEVNPDSAEAHMNLGTILMHERRPAEAVEHFQYVLKLSPKKSEAYAMLGVALAETGRLPEAAEIFRQALDLNPNDAETHKNLGNALLETGRPHEALEHLKRALDIKPNYAGAYYLTAIAYANIDQSAEAVTAAKKALDLARAQKQTALAGQIEDWLKAYERRSSGGDGRRNGR